MEKPKSFSGWLLNLAYGVFLVDKEQSIADSQLNPETKVAQPVPVVRRKYKKHVIKSAYKKSKMSPARRKQIGLAVKAAHAKRKLAKAQEGEAKPPKQAETAEALLNS